MDIFLRFGGGFAGISSIKMQKYALPENTVLGDVLELLARELGADTFQPSIMVTVNGTIIKEEERKTYLLKNTDVVSVICALAGG